MKHSDPTRQATSISSFAKSISVEDASLCVIDGPHQGLEVDISHEILRIGRAEWCDLVLSEDLWVSNLHCECWWDERGLRVRDLNSRNGISLGGAPVIEGYLIKDTQLKVGSSVLQLKLSGTKRKIPISFKDETGLLVGISRPMRRIFSMLPRIAQRQVTTLLLGETGTGKTSVARSIHLQHHPDDKTFVSVNCGALPANLIEGVLFGYDKGAFTGANKSHAGYFEQAHGGTLFLDEIAELPIELQPKLLDVIERKCVRRLGSEQDRQVDFHLLCATHQDLQKAIKQGRFREDLYFRISVVELEVPPLRQRLEDLPLLVEALLGELHPEKTYFITEPAVSRLRNYLWPGNIRELRNRLERSITFLDGSTISPDDIQLPHTSEDLSKEASPNAIRAHSVAAPAASIAPASAEWIPSLPLTEHEPPIPLKELLANTERFFLLQALDECDGNVLKASQLLGISDSWFYNRLKKYKLSPPK